MSDTDAQGEAPHAKGALTIRAASASDARAIGRLWSELQSVNAQHEPSLRPHRHGEEWYREFVELQCDDDAVSVLVAEHAGKVVGYLLAQILQRPTLVDGRIGFVADLCVHSDLRGQGIGTRLYEEAARWFRRRGVSVVELNVVSDNTDAARFWGGKGFSEIIRTMRVRLQDQ